MFLIVLSHVNAGIIAQNITLSFPVKSARIRLSCRLLLGSLTLKMEVICSPKMLGFFHTTRRYNPEGRTLYFSLILYRVGGTCRVYRLHHSVVHNLLLPTTVVGFTIIPLHSILTP
jgi:hypothetical protein